ncbi:integrase core domain-containing protein [Propionimicrobium sp. BV2F7]|uniref:integrase core domain-containing protein n=1 Tax=Propionimicrobium sp. BV2F7 TaxID=1111131 RepID=UPI0035106F90
MSRGYPSLGCGLTVHLHRSAPAAGRPPDGRVYRHRRRRLQQRPDGVNDRGLYKSELIDVEAGTWTDWGEVERSTAGWVCWYNHQRLHSSLGHIPPTEHYTNYQRENYAGRHAA